MDPDSSQKETEKKLLRFQISSCVEWMIRRLKLQFGEHDALIRRYFKNGGFREVVEFAFDFRSEQAHVTEDLVLSHKVAYKPREGKPHKGTGSMKLKALYDELIIPFFTADGKSDRAQVISTIKCGKIKRGTEKVYLHLNLLDYFVYKQMDEARRFLFFTGLRTFLELEQEALEPGRRRPFRTTKHCLFLSKSYMQLLRAIYHNDPALKNLQVNQSLGTDYNEENLLAIVSALEDNKTLQSLNLQSCGKAFTDNVMSKLVRSLKANHNIWTINLGENYRISSDGWQMLEKALPKTNIAFMYISEKHIDPKQKDRMRHLLRDNRHDPSRMRPWFDLKNMDIIAQNRHLWYTPGACINKRLKRS